MWTSASGGRVRVESRQLALRLRVRTERCKRFGGDHRAQLLDRAVVLVETLEHGGDAEPRSRLCELRIADTVRACGIQQRPPRAEARRQVMQVDILDLRDQLREERIARMAVAKGGQQIERAQWLLLVPEVDDVKLI